MSERRRPADVIAGPERRSRRTERRMATASRYPGAETPLVRGTPPSSRWASRTTRLRASGTTMRSACPRAFGTTSREGGQK
jgi:hypothetical protein